MGRQNCDFQKLMPHSCFCFRSRTLPPRRLWKHQMNPPTCILFHNSFLHRPGPLTKKKSKSKFNGTRTVDCQFQLVEPGMESASSAVLPSGKKPFQMYSTLKTSKMQTYKTTTTVLSPTVVRPGYTLCKINGLVTTKTMCFESFLERTK